MHTRYRRHLLPVAALGVALSTACHTAPAPSPAPSPSAPASGAVLLRIHPRVGEARHLRVVTDNFVHLGPGEPPPGDGERPTMHMIQFVTESVTAVSGDTTTTVMVRDSSRMEMPNQTLSAAALDSMFRGLTITTKMDGRGHVISREVKEPPQFAERMATLHRMFPGIPTGVDTSVASRGTSLRLPSHPVRVGATWADTSKASGALEAPGGVVVATYRLERLETRGGRRIALISSDVLTPALTTRMGMRVSAEPMHLAGELQLDLDTGWLVHSSTTMTAQLHTDMGDMSMRVVTRETPLDRGP